ncbi:hypothetical protein A3C96_00480 [Candidatus Uhrbacteria bacterium RIFCSPHIGHO2_02_FULL_60_10]|uniref:Uncharacterized protein n=1 Tax=Candidatus Uhrbacteria bacterium RIFCSPHIGHO2_02_FULL_60_10 TaxID=1802392 RepID=A0A1F7U6W3_9BACT|nr:MAG: hypothetical protein A3C96_00480 [Candidatus Uhrbacteria bacterium RIFCSPHIGHO2_02_FULL_60_10]
MNQKRPVLGDKKVPGVFILTAGLAAVIADRFFKSLVLAVPDVTPTGALSFTSFRNPGIAFSLPLVGLAYWVLAVPVAASLAAGLIIAYRRDRYEIAAALAVSLLGAASNLYDRAVYGAVIDYVIFFGRSAVNLADVLIVFGLLWAAFRLEKA